MFVKYDCPNPDCPPTDFEPIDTTENEGPDMELCMGDCSTQYPKGEIKRVSS